MLFNYNSNSLKPGIYEIKNLLSGKSYVGSAKRIKTRWQGHASSLRSGKHQNKHLQNSFNLHKTTVKNDDFIVFNILEIMDGSTKEERLVREEVWINELLQKNVELYNNQLRPSKEPKNRSCGSLTPEETSKKQSASLRKHYSDPENRAKQSLLLKGKTKPTRTKEHCDKIAASKRNKRHSTTTKEKMSAAHKTVKNLLILKQTYEKHKTEIVAKQIAAVSKSHTLIAPDGTIMVVENLNKFCKEKKLHSAGFSNLLRKTDASATYKGWKYLGSTSKRNK